MGSARRSASPHRAGVITDTQTTRSYPVSRIRNKIIIGDTLTVMAKMRDELFDMIFVDPPYFLQLPKKELRRWTVNTSVDAVTDRWDRFASFQEYDAFMIDVLTHCQRLLKAQGTIWVIGTYHSIFRIGKIMQDLGFWILNDVMWLKTNPMPNWLGVRFTNATETLIWAVRDKKVKGHTFDKSAAKEFGFGKVGANVWQIPLCTGKQRIKDDDGKKLHSTQKPIELLRRVILTSTQPGDLILDPMAGTGTTGVAAKQLKRHFVMIEKRPDYVKGVTKRLSQPDDQSSLNIDH